MIHLSKISFEMIHYLILISKLALENETHSYRTLEMSKMLNHGKRVLICVKKVD